PDDADRDVEPAALPARELRDPPVGELRETHRGEQLVDAPRPGLPRARVRLVVAAEVLEQRADVPAAVVAPRLQDDADARAPLLARGRRVLAEDPDRAVGSGPEALEDLDRRRLARTVGPQEGD